MLQKDGFIIVIGASAGGMKAIRPLLSAFDKDINAAIAVVIHVSRDGSSELMVEGLRRSTSLPCHVAADNMPLERGNVYLATAGLHLIIKENKLLLGQGPTEGRWRPAIDVALRSAAAAWDTHCIGIILTGMLDDGVAGMAAVKKCGGICIVQDPEEAEHNSMPLAVLHNMQVDRILRLHEMQETIRQLVRRDLPRVTPPDSVMQEAVLAEQAATHIDHMLHLLAKQVTGIEATLWTALQMMEERRALLCKLADKETATSLAMLRDTHRRMVREMELHIQRLKELLFARQQMPAD